MEFFNNKVIIVTGSSSGIGEETAVQFAARGAKVVLTGRSEERLSGTRQKCLNAGSAEDKLLVVAADVTKEDDIASIVGMAVERFGTIHVLVNNAGGTIPAHPCEETTGDDIISLMKTNTVSAFNMTKQALPHLVKTRGTVINVSSIGGTHAACAANASPINSIQAINDILFSCKLGLWMLDQFPSAMAYCMSKAAMDQMTRCMALAYADRGVRVNSVNPGDIVTPLHQTFASDTDYEDIESEYYQQIAKNYPMKRVGIASEVAEAILFLASNQSSFTTGMLLSVDGGRAYCLQGNNVNN